MKEDSSAERVGMRGTTALYFATLYFVGVGVLYLWGYWSCFGVNILEYLDASDVVKATAYPIASTVVFVIIGAVLGELTSGPSDTGSGDNAQTRVGRFLRNHIRLVLTLYVLGTLALFFFGPVEKWRAIPVLVGGPIYGLAKVRGLLSAQIPHDSTRAIILFIAAVLPFYSFGAGRIDADALLSGKKYLYVISKVDGLELPAVVPVDRRIRFLGQAGDYAFFLDPTSRAIAIAKVDAGKTMVLKIYETGVSVAQPKVGSG